MTRSVASNLTLSELPFPASLIPPEFETILSERLASLKPRLEAVGIPFNVEKLLTDPAAIIEREDAFRELLDIIRMIELAKGRMLAYAQTGDLDHIGALFGPKRFVIDAGDPDAIPARPPIYESDSEYRLRIQAAPETYPHAGLTGGAYRQIALAAAKGSLKDVRALKRWDSKGHPVIDIIILGRDGTGIIASEILTAVRRAFSDEAATQLTDIVTVRAARIQPYTVAATLQVPLGPDPALIRQTAANALAVVTDALHLIAEPMPLDALYAAARVGNVKRVRLNLEGDIEPDADEAALCTAITVTTEVIDAR